MEWRTKTVSIAILATATLGAARDAAADAHSGAQYLPAGLLFPEITHGIVTNAAGLSFQQGAAVGIEGVPPVFGGATSYDATFSYSSGVWDAGAGYLGSLNGATLSHTLLAGAGVHISTFGVGLMMQTPFVSSGLAPTFNVAAQIGNEAKIQFAAFLYGVPQTIDSMAFGIGHREAGKFSLEGGLRMPFFTNLFNSGLASYSVYVAGAVFAGPVGASFNATFLFSTPTNPTVGLGLLIDLGKRIKITALLDNGTLTSKNEDFALANGLTLGLTIAI